MNTLKTLREISLQLAPKPEPAAQAVQLINCTPHVVRLNDGREFPPSGILPRVGQVFSPAGDDFFICTWGQVVGLPDPEPNKLLIVSAMVQAAVSGRVDLVAPATGHPEARRENGHIVSVPGFITSEAGK